jgi:GMP synthase-like glutamine amidotransferase
VFRSFQWHNDSFDVPRGAVLTAFSATCPHQAFRIGQYAWGLQFHPEVTEEIIRLWAAADGLASARTEEMVSAFRSEWASYLETARILLQNFAKAATGRLVKN